jgi:glycosyltransferase involved in cell wall biosynthesis
VQKATGTLNQTIMAQKVLVISNYRGFHTGRPEAEIFVGLANMGVDITIMTFGDSEYVQRFEQAGIQVIDFHPKKKFDKKEIKFIRDTIIRQDIDILHLFNSKAIVNGIRAARGLGVKVVLYRGYAGNVHWYDPTAYIKYMHPRVDKIICNSKGVEAQLQRQLFLKNRKTVTIPKGHDTEWYKNIKPFDIKKELNLPPNAFLLVSVANNRKMKGIPYLLEAMHQLSGESSIHLLLIGRNMDSEENLELISKNNLKHQVHILGYREDVLNIVATCDVIVLASTKGEAINRSLAEAMSLGIPPVITNISGNNELVEHNESGLLFPPKNACALSKAIQKIYNHANLRQKLGEQAKIRMENEFNHRQAVIKTKAVYDELVPK